MAGSPGLFDWVFSVVLPARAQALRSIAEGDRNRLLRPPIVRISLLSINDLLPGPALDSEAIEQLFSRASADDADPASAGSRETA